MVTSWVGLKDDREWAYRVAIAMSLVVSVLPLLCVLFFIRYTSVYMQQMDSQMEYDIVFCEDVVKVASTMNSNHIVVHPADEFVSYFLVNSKKHIRNLRKAPQLFDSNPLLSPGVFVKKNRTGGPCRCAAERGPKGPPGRPGMKGLRGESGVPGIPAILPCQKKINLKKICFDPCPPGKQGPRGITGPTGDKGKRGIQGSHGKNGEDGGPGPVGPRGPPGIPGLEGDSGDPGPDAIPAPFITGPPGPAGDIGPIGPFGPRGMRGIDGPLGPAGKRGYPGRNGIPGKKGLLGPYGPTGKQGNSGHHGVCPTYCAIDGGVFFLDPEWLH
ncbi:unnamed protein product [Dracunculus medinensis]|uniref:Col_cuticle_N domain-containing protein n=1 Tax=Dracunculus medinensis TaxID=318479 RepID=A0A0N4UEM4_DRAME|nr:unnamed protein product [Dracunculus medinensis]